LLQLPQFGKRHLSHITQASHGATADDNSRTRAIPRKLAHQQLHIGTEKLLNGIGHDVVGISEDLL